MFDFNEGLIFGTPRKSPKNSEYYIRVAKIKAGVTTVSGDVRYSTSIILSTQIVKDFSLVNGDRIAIKLMKSDGYFALVKHPDGMKVSFTSKTDKSPATVKFAYIEGFIDEENEPLFLSKQDSILFNSQGALLFNVPSWK